MPEVSADFWYLRKRRRGLVLEPEDEDDPREPTLEEQEAEMRAAGVGDAEGAEPAVSLLKRPILVPLGGEEPLLGLRPAPAQVHG